MPDEGVHREIFNGELIEKPPPKPRHEILTNRIYMSLGSFNQRVRLGDVFGSRMGYRVLKDQRTWLEPDISFLRIGRLPADLDSDYVDGSPDLAIEVISPSESAQDVEDKIDAYLQGGAHAVVVVYPKKGTVRLFLTDGTARTLRAGDTVSLPDLLPGWELPINEIFAE